MKLVKAPVMFVLLVVTVVCCLRVVEAFKGSSRVKGRPALSRHARVQSRHTALPMARAGSFGVKDKGEVFFCSECGTEHINWSGRCTSCREWNTVKQFRSSKAPLTPIDIRAAASSSKMKRQGSPSSNYSKAPPLKKSNVDLSDIPGLSKGLSSSSFSEDSDSSVPVSKSRSTAVGGGFSSGVGSVVQQATQQAQSFQQRQASGELQDAISLYCSAYFFWSSALVFIYHTLY